MTDQSLRFVSRLTRNTLALILAGGRGSRLKHLTKWRSKPAVPFGGKFRIVDFPLSNCINSGIRRVGVLTQYKAHSLLLHIQRGWGFLRGEFGEFVELLPAQQRIESSWYEGTADAVYQNLDILRSHDPDYVLILAGDHIYKMDYGTMIAEHVESGADMTVGCLTVDLESAKEFGVMTVDEDNWISEFKDRVLAYPFRDSSSGKQAYWRDVGTIDAFWTANLELIGVTPPLNLYDRTWPIWTYQEQLPPAKFVFDDDERRGMAVDSMVSGGCVISGAKVINSLLFSNVRVNSYSTVDQTVVLPDVNIGRNCKIVKAVIDRGCDIPEGTQIGLDPKADAERFYVTDTGIVLVTPEMLGQVLHHVR
ncbi:MAG: glucose-1-phosphate adenylyltransferase [Candidatus Thiodiazotropha sp.]